MKTNYFLNLFNSPLMKLDSVTRFSGVSQNTKESLSDHITDVCAISYIIARKLIVNGQNVDIGKLLEKCVIHDMDEVLVGDIPRLTKYATKTCHDELNKISEFAAKGISRDIDGTDYTYELWVNSKDNSVEGFILKISDILSVIKKTVHEIDFSNNINFIQVAYEASLYVDDLSKYTYEREGLSDKSRDYLSSLLNDAKELLQGLINENKKKAKNYKIIGSDITNYLLDHRHAE